MKKLLFLIIPACISCHHNAPPKEEFITPRGLKKETIAVFIKNDKAALQPAQKLIVNVSDTYSLVLPEEMKKIIEAYDPDFKLRSMSDFVKSIDGNLNYYKCSLKQLPYAVAGEFNGDSVTDLILLGYNKRNSLILGIISSANTYNVTEIQKRELVNPKDDWIDEENNKGLSAYLEHFSSAQGSKAMKFSMIKNDAFTYGIYGKGSAIFWYEEGKFKSAAFTD